jgi:hypothetical protein
MSFDQTKEIVLMKRRYSGPRIVAHLRQADVVIGRGRSIAEVCKQLEISEVQAKKSLTKPQL